MSLALEETIDIYHTEDATPINSEPFLNLIRHFTFKGETAVVNHLQRKLMQKLK